jgi:chromosome partition protein MukF
VSTPRRNLGGTERSVDQVVAAIADRKPSLELGPIDICFLIALHVRAEGANLTSFTEQQLEDVFAHASSVVQPAADNVRRRATHAIARLRAQRLLARVDGQGVVRTGEFALSRLGTAIVEFYLEDDVLTRASLAVLTTSLKTALADVLATARAATSPPQWRDVVGPLEVTIGELVAGIERRQRGLDLQQEDFQAEIRRLLEADWFGALDRCQALLESTSATLHELNEVLLRDSTVLLSLLQDIEDVAVAAGDVAAEAESAAHRLMDQIDRSVAWGTARQRAWSEYFQYVHRYLRDVVRLDPTRALSQRLREQLAGNGAKFALAYASAPPLRILRTVMRAPDRPPVVRPRQPREKEPAAEAPVDPQAILDEKVQRSLDGGARVLSSVTADVTAELAQGERFVEAGRVAHTVAQLARVASGHERPWVAVDSELEIEEWRVDGTRGAREPR